MMLRLIKYFTLILTLFIISISYKAEALDENVQQEQIKKIERFALILDVSGLGYVTQSSAFVKNDDTYFYASSRLLTTILEKQGYLVVCLKAGDFDSFGWRQLEAKLDDSELKFASSASEGRQILVFVTAYGIADSDTNQQNAYIYSSLNVSSELKAKWSTMNAAQLDAQPELVSLKKLDDKILSYGFHKNVTIYNFLSDVATRDASGNVNVRSIDLDKAKEHWNDQNIQNGVPLFYYRHIYLKNLPPDNCTAKNIYKTLYDGIDGCADAVVTLKSKQSRSDGFVDADELLEYLRAQYGDEVISGEKITANTIFRISTSRHKNRKFAELINIATSGTNDAKDRVKGRRFSEQFSDNK